MYVLKSSFLCFDKFVNLDDKGRAINSLTLIDNSNLGKICQKIASIFDKTISVSVKNGKKIKSYHVTSRSFKRFIRKEFSIRFPGAIVKIPDEWVNRVFNQLNKELKKYPLQQYFSRL